MTLEYADEAVVFNLDTALAHGFGGAAYVGAIPLGNAAVGMAVSPDGRWLYATSEGTVARQHAVALGSTGCQGHVPGAVPGEPPGTLTVVDLRRAESDPAQSVTATVDAGYQPVRVVTAADGTEVWVTVGDLPAGGFPRDMSLSPDGTLLVSDYTSGQVQAIATAGLPAAG